LLNSGAFYFYLVQIELIEQMNGFFPKVFPLVSCNTSGLLQGCQGRDDFTLRQEALHPVVWKLLGSERTLDSTVGNKPEVSPEATETVIPTV
jgi:hypothetical protein